MTELAHIASRRYGFRTRRHGLLVSAALGVVLGVVPTGRAEAQTAPGGFQGTPSFDPAQVEISSPSANTTLVRMKAPVATINWTPTDNQGSGPINFLPQGSVGIFENDPSAVTNFAVLNRIVPADTSRRVDFNGQVISRLRDAAGNVTGPGGSVAFYSPGGIFISSTAVFDVGSLLLTTLDPVRDGSGNFFGAAGNISLVGAPDGTSSVVTAAGSQINALAAGSYVGLVAPRVEHDGAIRVNGSVGLIAAEALDLTIADGLFNIVVQTGTPVADAIVSNGSIGGPASTGGADNHVIYAVAVPKNQAITAVLRGSVGFDAATTATIENGEIILSAGHNVNGRQIATNPVAGSLGASAVLDSGSYSSDVRARGVTDAAVRTFSGNASFGGDVSLFGSERAFIAAENGRTVTVLGNALVSNLRGDRFGANGAGSGVGSVASFGSEATIQAAGDSTVDIRGNATVDGSVRGLFAQAGIGGRAEIFAFGGGTAASGGTVTIGGSVELDASGLAGATSAGSDGPDGIGGRAAIQSSGGATIAVAGDVTVTSLGLGGIRQGGTDNVSGAGTGGTARIEGFGGTITIGGDASVNATGFGGSSSTAGNGGTGTGGNAQIFSQNGTTVLLGGATTLVANGVGGRADAGDGGSGAGGTAQIGVFNNGILNGGSVSVRAGATGGQGSATGGAATGGTARVDSGTGGQLTLAGTAELSADATGGAGVSTGGAGTGGLAQVFANGSTTRLEGSLAARLTAQGRGGAGATGGAGTGGMSQVGAFNGGDVVAPNGSAALGDGLIVRADGFGASGATAGGVGRGGMARIDTGSDNDVAADSTISASIFEMSADGFGGGGTGGNAPAGDAFGGRADVVAANQGSLVSTGRVVTNAGAVGGNATTGTAGNATGGETNVGAGAGQLTVTGEVSIAARGFAGTASGASGNGGDAIGGAARINIFRDGGAVTVGGAAVIDGSAFGVGGGSAQGGFAGVVAGSPGTMSLQTIDAAANGTGGSDASGTGGDGRGGHAQIFVNGGTMSFTTATLNSGGFGGNGLTGGLGRGGQNEGTTVFRGSVLNANNGAQVTGTSVVASSVGRGGIGTAQAGGAGEGGRAEIFAFNNAAITLANASNMFATGTGGEGQSGAAGGAGTGGSAGLFGQSGSVTRLNGGGLLNANGVGGSVTSGGGNGGAGSGGRAQAGAPGGTLNMGGTVNVNALGLGGAGLAASGGNGGIGTGGFALMFANDGSVTFNVANVNAVGIGGAGAVGGEGRGGGFDRPAADFATAGAFASARRGQIDGSTLTVNASGTGGNSATGVGAAGTGGDAFITAFNGSFPNDNVAQDGPARITVSQATVDARARGGNGGTSASGIGQTGGAALAGTAGMTAQAINGTLDIDSAAIFVGAQGGAGGAGANSSSGAGGPGGAGGAAIAGFVNVGQVSGNTDTPAAAKTGSANFGTLTASASAQGGGGGAGGTGTTAGAGGVGGNAVGGSVALLARGATLNVGTANLNATATGGLGGIGGDAVRALSGRGAGGFAGAFFTPFFDIVANAETTVGPTVTIGTLNLNSQGSRAVAGASGVTFEEDQYGAVQLDVRRGTATIGSALLSVGGVEARNLTALGLSSPYVAATPDPTFVRADNGALAFTTANGGAGRLDLFAPSDIEIAAVGAGTIRAATEIDLNTAGRILFSHASAPADAVAIAAPLMSFTSSRIEVNALVGDASTSAILLFADEQDAPAVIGGDVEEAGYTLTRAEAARLQADSISLEVDAIDEDRLVTDVFVRDITLQGTANGDGTARIDLFADGIIRIEGQVNYVDTALTDSLSIGSDTRIELITPTGGIRMTAPDGSLSGLLEFDTTRFIAADAALTAQLVADPIFAGRAAALRTNTGPVNPAGSIQAGGVVIEVDSEAGDQAIYVQNSGTSTDFAGITVGAAGLTIASVDPEPVDLIAFGRRVNPDGSFTAGEAFFADVEFSRTPADPSDIPTAYTATSEFNSCNVNNGCAPVLPPPVLTVAFAGTPTVASGTVAFGTDGPNTDVIRINSATAVINWTPTDNGGTGPINFLPQGKTGIFENGAFNSAAPAVSNFAVLNRIIPADTSRRVDFNGRVVSQLRDAAGNVAGPGGTVAFYSPGGIFVSPTAVFDVGSLLLSGLDPLRSDGSFLASNGFQLRGVAGSTAAVTIAQGAQLNAVADGSYVALVAPRVEQAGAIRVNGSAALIAAESVDLSINNGLFDINVQSGTGAADALVHSGSTGGPAASSSSDTQRIYAVAVPKNQAITALLRGSLGFDPPASASIENGAIILSSGHNVSGNTIAAQPLGQAPANLTLGGGTTRLTSDATVRTSGSLTLGTALYSGDLDAFAAGDAIIEGEVDSRRISLASADIDVRTGAILGNEDVPGVINLTANATGQQVVLGGTAEGPGYTLTQAELERIEAQTATFTAPAQGSAADRPADVLMRDLTIAGSQIGGPSAVTVSTPGRLRIEGAVQYRGAAATDTLTLSATERLEVVTPTGSINVTNSQNAPSGVLQLGSQDIVVTSAQLAQQLAANPNFDGRNAALRANGGPVNPAGNIVAGGIRLLASRNIFIQNTGTATEFAGLTVGGGGLVVGRFTQGGSTGGGSGGGTGSANTFSFVGTLMDADGELFFDFTITGQSDVTLRSYSYAGGTNGQGSAIPAGGFDPILALFDAMGALIGQNDDGGSNVPADPTTGSRFDVFLQRTLAPGSYRVSVTAFSNFANGPNLSNGFSGGGSFNGRTQNFAFDVIGANSATGPGQTASQPITAVGFGRRQNADGSFTTGDAFFSAVDFGANASQTFATGSEFNTRAIGQALPPPPPHRMMAMVTAGRARAALGRGSSVSSTPARSPARR